MNYEGKKIDWKTVKRNEGKEIVVRNLGEKDIQVIIDKYGNVLINGYDLSCDQIQVISHIALKRRTEYFENNCQM